MQLPCLQGALEGHGQHPWGFQILLKAPATSTTNIRHPDVEMPSRPVLELGLCSWQSVLKRTSQVNHSHLL